MIKKLICAATLATILLINGLLALDDYMDRRLRNWYEENYTQCSKVDYIEEPREMPTMDLTAYVYFWKSLYNLAPAVANALWERPEFGKTINVKEFDSYYYGYGIQPETVIKIN